MLIKYSELVNAVDSVKAVLSDNKNDQVNILLSFNKHEENAMVAYSDGRKAVVKRIGVEYGEDEVVADNVIVTFKRILDVMDMAKPVGALSVEEVELFTDTAKKQLDFKVEKVVYMVADDEDAAEMGATEKKVIATLKQSFKYTSAEDDRRQAALLRPNYVEMLGEAPDGVESDTWARTELIKVLSKVCSEDDKQIVMSGKNNTVAVSNLNYTVWMPRDEVEHALCLSVKMAKNISEVMKRCSADNVEVRVSDLFCTVRDDEGTVAFWFESEKPMKKVLNVIDGYVGLPCDKFGLVVMKDALANVSRCVGDAKDIALEFTGNLVDGVKIKVGGGDTAAKTNDFTVEATEITGDVEELTHCKFTVTADTLRSMVDLCDSVYIMVNFNVDESGLSVMRVSDVEKVSGQVVRNIDSFTPAIFSKQ